MAVSEATPTDDDLPWWGKALVWVLAKASMTLVYLAMIWVVVWWLNFTVFTPFHETQLRRANDCVGVSGLVVVGPFGGVTCHWPKGAKVK